MWQQPAAGPQLTALNAFNAAGGGLGQPPMGQPMARQQSMSPDSMMQAAQMQGAMAMQGAMQMQAAQMQAAQVMQQTQGMAGGGAMMAPAMMAPAMMAAPMMGVRARPPPHPTQMASPPARPPEVRGLPGLVIKLKPKMKPRRDIRFQMEPWTTSDGTRKFFWKLDYVSPKALAVLAKKQKKQPLPEAPDDDLPPGVPRPPPPSEAALRLRKGLERGENVLEGLYVQSIMGQNVASTPDFTAYTVPMVEHLLASRPTQVVLVQRMADVDFAVPAEPPRLTREQQLRAMTRSTELRKKLGRMQMPQKEDNFVEVDADDRRVDGSTSPTAGERGPKRGGDPRPPPGALTGLLDVDREGVDSEGQVNDVEAQLENQGGSGIKWRKTVLTGRVAEVMVAQVEQPIRSGKNKGSNHCGVLKQDDVVLVCERWLEVDTTITRMRVRVRDFDSGCFSPTYTGWVRLADRDPDQPGDPRKNPRDNSRRELFTRLETELGDVTERGEM